MRHMYKIVEFGIKDTLQYGMQFRITSTQSEQLKSKKDSLKSLKVKCNSLLHKSLYQDDVERNRDLILKIAEMYS